MYALLRLLLMVFLSMGGWLATGRGVGFLLHWCGPAIALGMGTFIGVVTLSGGLLWLSRMSTLEALYGHDESARPDATWSTTPQAAWRSARRKRRGRRS